MRRLYAALAFVPLLASPAIAAVDPAPYDWTNADASDTASRWEAGAVMLQAPTAFRYIGQRNDYFSGDHAYGCWSWYAGIPATLQPPALVWVGGGGGMTNRLVGPLSIDLTMQLVGGGVFADPNGSTMDWLIGAMPTVGAAFNLWGGSRLTLTAGYLVSIINPGHQGLLFTAAFGGRKTTITIPSEAY